MYVCMCKQNNQYYVHTCMQAWIILTYVETLHNHVTSEAEIPKNLDIVAVASHAVPCFLALQYLYIFCVFF